MSVKFTEILVGRNMVSLIGVKIPLPIHELLLQKAAMVELDVSFAIRSPGTHGLTCDDFELSLNHVSWNRSSLSHEQRLSSDCGGVECSRKHFQINV